MFVTDTSTMRTSLLLLTTLALASCNVAKVLDRKNTEAYEKHALQPHTFEDFGGSHFT